MPNQPVEIRVNTEQLAKLDALGERAKDGRVPLKRWFGWYGNMLADMFTRIGRGSSGGSMRGVTWSPFANQYRRKTDGVLVPAWGGVSKMRRRIVGKPGHLRLAALQKGDMVKGRKRQRGRVRSDSWLMRDTGRMFGETRQRPLALDANHLRIGPTVEYAEYQNKWRPFLFIYPPQDEPSLAREFDFWYEELIAQTGTGS